jgi:hypothetical protein
MSQPGESSTGTHYVLGVGGSLNYDGDRLAALGYRQELSRILSLFDSFADLKSQRHGARRGGSPARVIA